MFHKKDKLQSMLSCGNQLDDNCSIIYLFISPSIHYWQILSDISCVPTLGRMRGERSSESWYGISGFKDICSFRKKYIGITLDPRIIRYNKHPRFWSEIVREGCDGHDMSRFYFVLYYVPNIVPPGKAYLFHQKDTYLFIYYYCEKTNS